MTKFYDISLKEETINPEQVGKMVELVF